MPIITIETWPMDKEKKKQVIKNITKVFTEMHIPAEAVSIVIHESSKDNWGTAGEQHSIKFKDMK